MGEGMIRKEIVVKNGDSILWKEMGKLCGAL